MKTQKCIVCGRETVSVIKHDDGPICYNCYSDKKNPPKQKRHYGNEESKLQQSCIDWFRSQYPGLAKLLFAVPNGSRRDAITGAILKREGVVSGVADLILLIPQKGYASLCIEMKYGKNGQSASQKEWQQLAEAAGNKYVVCKSLSEFMEQVNRYLKKA